GAMAWFGYGVDVRAVTRDHTALDAVLGYAVARASMLGDAGGAGFEVAAGAGADGDGVHAAGLVGTFFGLYYGEIGYSYQFPLGGERPGWLASHQFSIRIHIPLARHDRREWDETPRETPRPSDHVDRCPQVESPHRPSM